MEIVFLGKYVLMIPRRVFKNVSDRLNFLFPPDSFVYINLSAESNGRLDFQPLVCQNKYLRAISSIVQAFFSISFMR